MAAQLPLDIAGVLAIRFEVSTVVRVTEIVRWLQGGAGIEKKTRGRFFFEGELQVD